MFKLAICLILFANSTNKAYAAVLNNSTDTGSDNNATVIVDPTDAPLPVMMEPRMFDSPESGEEEYGDASSEDRVFKRSAGYGRPPQPPTNGGYQRHGNQYGGSSGNGGSSGVMGGMPSINYPSPCSGNSGSSYPSSGQSGYQQPSGSYKRKHKN